MHTRRSTRILASPIATLIACLIAQRDAGAQTTYIWNTAAGGSWGNAALWTPAGPAAGAGNIADFSTQNITAAAAVTLDGNRTIGAMRFADATTASHDWTVNVGSSGTLTLDATSGPGVITVTNRTATIAPVIAGNDGFLKDGAGTLRLNGANTWSGSITVANGVLQLGNNAAISTLANTIDVTNAGLTTGGNGTTLSILDNITLAATKTVRMIGGPSNNRISLLGQNNAVMQGNIEISGNSLTQILSNAGTFTVNGSITGTSGDFAVRGGGTGVINGNINIGNRFAKTDGGTWIINTTGHTWTTWTQISDGVLQLGINNAFPTNLPLVIGQGSATNGRFEMNGFNQTVDSLRSDPASSGTAHAIRNSNRNTPSTLTFSTATGATDVLRNVQLFGAPQATGQLNLVKNGSGRLELQNGRVDNASIALTDGTLAFTGDDNRVALAAISGPAISTVEKSGFGYLHMAGTYAHEGTTLINSGRMSFSSGTAGSILVGPGAVLSGGYNEGRLSADTVFFSSATGFIGRVGGPATPLINAANLSVTDVTEVNIEAASLTPGVYKMIGYGAGAIGGAGFAGFTLGTPGNSPHMTAVLQNSGTSIDINVTAMDSLVWTGANSGAWDRNVTPNFKLASDGSLANFYQSDSVLFDDTGFTKAITGVGSLTVGNLVFNNSAFNDYTIDAALGGPGGLIKVGAGTTTISNTASTSPITMSGPINVAEGTLILNAANPSHGPVTISGGTLTMGHADAIASGALVKVSNGGTLDVNGRAPNLRIPEIRISGTGVGGNGAVVNNGAAITNLSSFSKIVVEGDVSWGGSGRNDLPATTVLEGNGFILTKVGTGEMWFSPTTQSALGGIVVNGGTLGIQTANPLGATPVTVNSGAFHSIYSAVTVSHPITLNDFGTLRSTNSTPIVAGTITLNGTNAFRNIQATNNTTLNVAGKITGTGGFTLADAGIVQIQNATNDYLGDTVINGTTGANTTGTLNFNANGALPATTNLIVNSGTFDPSNKTHTVASISGNGGIIGQATAGTGVIITTQASQTFFGGSLNRVLVRMNGTGELALGGTTDNSTGTIEANSGRVIFAKTGDYAAHSIGAAGVGLTVNSGATVQLAGNLTGTTSGTGNNIPPADIVVGAPPANYVDQIFNLTDVVLNTGGTLDLNGRMEAIDALTGAGTITNTASVAGRLYVGYGNTAATFGGVIENGGGGGTNELSKIGTGTLVLTGTNTYTGPTTVSAGTLQVDGQLANTAVGLIAGALQGSGTIAGTVTAAIGTTINPGVPSGGASAATLTVGGLNLPAGGARNLVFDHNGTAADKIAVTGSNGLTLDGTNNVTMQLGESGWATGTYPLLTYSGTVGGAGAASLVLQNPKGHNTVTIADNGTGAINLQVTATTLKYLGSSTAWDNNATINWNSGDGLFLNGDNVLFDDTAANSAPTIASTVTPASVIVDTAAAYSISGAAGIAGTGNLTKRGVGTLTLSNPNTYTGRTNVQNGTLIADYATGIPLPAASVVDVASAGTVALTHPGGVFAIANSYTGMGTILVDPNTTNAGNRDLGAVTGNLSGFTGTLRLAPTSGSMRIQVDNAADIGNGAIDIKSGGQIFFSAANVTVPNNMTIAGAGYIETAGSLGALRAANPTTFTGAIIVDGSAKIGAYSGLAVLQGAVTGGALTLGGNNNANINETFQLLGDASTLSSITLNGGSTNAGTITLELGNGIASGQLGSVPLTLRTDGKTSVLRIRQGNDFVLNAPITATGNVNLQLDTVAGTTNGKGATLTQSINLNAGTIQVGSPALANGAIAKATIDLAAGNALAAGSFFMGDQAQKQALVDHLAGDVNLSGRLQIGHWPSETSVYNLGGGTLNLTGAAPAAFPFSTAVSEQLGGVYLGIDGTGVLNQTGGTLSTNFIVLDNRGNTGAALNMTTGVDTYTLDGGILVLKSSYGIISRHATAAVNLLGGTIQADTDTTLDSDKITVSGLTTLSSAGRTFTLTGPLAGAGALKVSGPSTLRTSDSAALAGGSLGAVSAQIEADSTILADRTGSDTWTGAFDGPGKFIKANTGSLTITGSSPGFTGLTEINGGTLIVQGSLAGSAVTVNTGATLMGNGTVGALDVKSGATLAVGTSAGLLDAGATIFEGGTFAVELNGVTVETGYDQLRVTGTVSIAANTALTLSLGFTPVMGQSFTIVDNDLADAVNRSAGLFTFGGTPLPDNTEFGQSLFANGESFRIDYDGGVAGGGNDIVLTVVPEPGSAALLLCGLGSMIGLRRARRRV